MKGLPIKFKLVFTTEVQLVGMKSWPYIACDFKRVVFFRRQAPSEGKKMKKEKKEKRKKETVNRNVKRKNLGFSIRFALWLYIATPSSLGPSSPHARSLTL